MELLEKIWKPGKDFLGVKYPIISGAMTWISDYALCKAVSEAGGFPVLAGGNMPPDLFEAEVRRCLDGLDGPFAANLITIAPNYRAHYDILLDLDVPFVVFAGNFPKKPDIQGMKAAGKRTIAFSSTKSITDRLMRGGIDALILEGSEAGGHIGYVSLMVLIQQVLFEYDDFPIFCAGGLATGKMVAHLLLMGAAGCQFGTLFAMSEECSAHPKFKEAFVKANARSAVSTPQYDSKLPVVAVRALNNKAMADFGVLQMKLLKQLEAGELTRIQAQYLVEGFWVGSLQRAVRDGDVETGSLMAGQSVGLVHEVRPMKDILETLVQDAEEELQRCRGKLHM